MNTPIMEILSKDLNLENLKENTHIVKPFLDLLKDKNKVTLFINRKKIKMQKIYYNLMKELLKHCKPGALREHPIDQTYRGFLTNYNSHKFMETEMAIIILTKKHSDKEKAILKQLIKNKTTVVILSLCEHFYLPNSHIYLVHDTRGLYHFMYLLTLNDKNLSYADFSKEYELTLNMLNFEALRTKPNEQL